MLYSRNNVTWSVIALLSSTISAHSVANNGILHQNSYTDNSNHIFNAIHAAMRQWGSSWHRNGMSFFLATVPQGSHFFHGTRIQEPVKGMQWLAFEPEHSMVFTMIDMPPPKDEDFSDNDGHLDFETNGAVPKTPGYLHTYVTKHDLNLLYIDGMSAGKTGSGTQDSQDYLLLNGTVDGSNLLLGEFQRALMLCEMAKTKWENKIDGVIRTEAGFEIILCDFEAHVEQAWSTRGRWFNGTDWPEYERGFYWEWVRALVARYEAIGNDRGLIDFENFVTAYTHDLELFHHGSSDQNELPRLNSIPLKELEPIRAAVDRMILSSDTNKSLLRRPTPVNYQSMADTLVNRYSFILQHLTTFTNETDAVEEIAKALEPFIDFDKRDDAAEIERCVRQSVPLPQKPIPNDNGEAFLNEHNNQHPLQTSRQNGPPLAYKAIHTVAEKICTTLHSIATTTNLDTKSMTPTAKIKDLVSWLDWSHFARCQTWPSTTSSSSPSSSSNDQNELNKPKPGACAIDELCFIPMWPLGWYGTINATRVPGRCVNKASLEHQFDHDRWDFTQPKTETHVFDTLRHGSLHGRRPEVLNALRRLL